jgi:hypothetical protein
MCEVVCPYTTLHVSPRYQPLLSAARRFCCCCVDPAKKKKCIVQLYALKSLSLALALALSRSRSRFLNSHSLPPSIPPLKLAYAEEAVNSYCLCNLATSTASWN